MRAERRGDVWADGLTSAAFVLAAATELAMVESYFRVGASLAGLVFLFLVALVSLFALLAAVRLSGRARHFLLRSTVCVAMAATACLALWPSLSSRLTLETGVGLLALGVGTVLGAPPSLWARLRPALAISALVFVWSQPVMAAVGAPSLAWPSNAVDKLPRAGSEATLVLLLDEWNAKDTQAVEVALRRQGLEVATRAVEAVDRNTSEAVPSMFASGRFHGAKPCSPTAICAGQRILDFSRVTASRPDIDVVGFFHPYCAIQGLRSCVAVAMPYELLNVDRWQCALARRTGWPASASPGACAAFNSRQWESLRTGIIGAVHRAPVLARGGMLFAHVPLPHPPGNEGVASLSDDYRGNVLRAAALVEKLTAEAHSNGLAVRVLLFSDHPLRQSHWCFREPRYGAAGCSPDPSLDDDRVPIVVAAESLADLPSLENVRSNAEAFGLVDAFGATR